jgi:disulfide bond formation protein DsbB
MLNPLLPFKSARIFYAALAAVCIGLLAFGYYLQFFAGQEPCPLCIFQRLAYFTIACVGLLGAIHAPKGWGRLGYSGTVLLAALAGVAIAGRQVWLQHLPADMVPECGPALDYMLEVFPLSDALRMVFSGSGECAEVTWTFLSLSIAEWSLLCFLLLAAAALGHIWNNLPRRNTGGTA